MNNILNNDFVESKLIARDLLDWDQLVAQMNAPNTATKFFGTGLFASYPAQKWFRESVDRQSHEVFVLLRNPTEICWSLLLARQFGFFKYSEIEPYEITINDFDIVTLDRTIDCFLRYYPKKASVVTFDQLPSEFFDYSKIELEDQKSFDTKIHLITNRSFVEDKLHKILSFYSEQYEDLTGKNIFFKK